MSTLYAEPTPLRVSPLQAARHGLALAGRGVTKLLKTPIQLVDVILTPIVFLLMFVYLFGGAIGGGDIDGYLRTIVPGIMVMTVFQASIGIGVSLNADAGTGVFDRFRSMPIARSAPLVGAVLADIVRYVVSLAVLLTLALIMGYRIQTGPVATLAAVALLLGFALSFSWLSVYVGMLVRTPGSVQGLMTILVLPLTFASNVFVPAQTMPGWLRVWSEVNPVSLMADTVRGLLNGGEVAGPLTGALVWMAAVVAIFFPLAMRAYRKNAA
ncbi:oleandomycin transport system permease protein [Nonomuraea solani]|uniref:Transport permease protein n=1 Tax=Nonomuraea solani TaxID=1144553 RepID=A0A1H6EY46_9ACTN|nr:ABC transporter permease [Nonomuraea solani]SEH01799.1 oleandomycin transport system permease protein [Nonomuraea solani]